MHVTIPVNLSTIVHQLPLREKLRLVRQLERETWAARLDKVVHRLRARSSTQRISPEEISQLVEDVRKARYVRATRRP